ncbi:MAG: cytochrome P450, partial [Planctomycetales bacterium]|nr:cytochrome P450 [Planctomycetales bacterium]
MTWPITQSSRVAPGPSGGWTFGVLRSFQRDALGFLTEATATYGDVVRLQFGPITAHLVNHPSHVEQVLVRCSPEFDKRTRSVSKIRATCGDSLLSSEGRLWQKHRRIMQPLFRDKELARYIGTIEDAIEQMLRGWRVTAGQGEPVDMIHAMMGLTLNIATRVFFDCDIDRHTETIEHALKDILTDTWRRVESPVDLASMFPMLHRKAFRRAIADLDAIVYEIIAERRHRPRDAGDLLSRLLDANQATSDQQLSDRELRDAVLTLLLAGHETTANALTWAFCCISQSLAAEKRICDSVSMQYVGCDHQD